MLPVMRQDLVDGGPHLDSTQVCRSCKLESSVVKEPVEATRGKTWRPSALKPCGWYVTLVFLRGSRLLLGPILSFPVHSISEIVGPALEVSLNEFRPVTSLI